MELDYLHKDHLKNFPGLSFTGVHKNVFPAGCSGITFTLSPRIKYFQLIARSPLLGFIKQRFRPISNLNNETHRRVAMMVDIS